MRRIQWTRYAGQPLPPNTKLITRPGKYGNPWKVGDGATREDVVARFESYLADRSQHPEVAYPSDDEIVRDLDGYDLACACNHHGPCHGDALIRHIHTLNLLATTGGAR
ncbi:DUF4326 domain-containing protein [Micromonospora sp. NPDC048986]|uniref:DUF4326 domain-containing protein n=1 Tax=Micromonospora sp. NPDC048986 TaxID=3155644 RepID=UPI0033FE8220